MADKNNADILAIKIYRSVYESIENDLIIEDDDKSKLDALDVYRTITKYTFDNIEPDYDALDRVARSIVRGAVPNLDAYLESVRGGGKGGKKSANNKKKNKKKNKEEKQVDEKQAELYVDDLHLVTLTQAEYDELLTLADDDDLYLQDKIDRYSEYIREQIANGCIQDKGQTFNGYQTIKKWLIEDNIK